MFFNDSVIRKVYFSAGPGLRDDFLLVKALCEQKSSAGGSEEATGDWYHPPGAPHPRVRLSPYGTTVLQELQELCRDPPALSSPSPGSSTSQGTNSSSEEVSFRRWKNKRSRGRDTSPSKHPH